ncbi:MAG TPA: hypothetical protein VK570_12040 [Rubrivivax sp.]|nr:hypothetical protein [Rubrivivax sp.]
MKLCSAASPLLDFFGHGLVHQAWQQLSKLLARFANRRLGRARQGRCQSLLQTCFQQQLEARLQLGHYLGSYLGS